MTEKLSVRGSEPDQKVKGDVPRLNAAALERLEASSGFAMITKAMKTIKSIVKI